MQNTGSTKRYRWGNDMNKFGKSQPILRNEDARFLTGKGTFVDSTPPRNSLHAHFFRSPVAHATIKLLNLSDARQAEGVHLVLGADDLVLEGITEGLMAVMVLLLNGRC
jgi:carbon-monoxide dehydrogenase large subunit